MKIIITIIIMKLPHILSLFNIIYSLYDIFVVVHLYIFVVVHLYIFVVVHLYIFVVVHLYDILVVRFQVKLGI